MKKVVLATVALLFIQILTMFASSALIAVNDPRIRADYSTSTNWSGYAVQFPDLSNPQSGVVTDVKGSWVVPAISGSAKNTYSSFWVGIDGYSSNTVEQIGTDSDTNYRGQAVYYAWYEMYPAYPYTIPLSIKPGDQITAEVSYTGSNTYVLSITDQRSGSYSTTRTLNGAQRSSAEWIAEAPSSGRVLPLANFGTVIFTSCSAVMTSGTGSISSTLWQYDPLTMVTGSGRKTTIKATPSVLSSDGSGFSVTWSHS